MMFQRAGPHVRVWGRPLKLKRELRENVSQAIGVQRMQALLPDSFFGQGKAAMAGRLSAGVGEGVEENV